MDEIWTNLAIFPRKKILTMTNNERIVCFILSKNFYPKDKK